MNITLPTRREYSLTVDNAAIWLLTEKPEVPNKYVDHLHHFHMYAEVFVCCQGEIQLELLHRQDTPQAYTETLHLYANDTAIVPAHLRHHRVNIDTGAAWYAIGFSVRAHRSDKRTSLYRQLTRLHKSSTVYIGRNNPTFCEEIRSLCQTEYPTDSPVPVLRFVLALLGHLELCAPETVSPPADFPDTDTRTDLSMLDHILSSQFTSKLTCASVADLLHISERQLARIVRKRYGAPFHQVLLEKRLDTAAYLLQHTDKSMAEIAREAGFSSPHAFRRSFSKKYGIPPQQFREDKKDAVGEKS